MVKVRVCQLTYTQAEKTLDTANKVQSIKPQL